MSMSSEEQDLELEASEDFEESGEGQRAPAEVPEQLPAETWKISKPGGTWRATHAGTQAERGRRGLSLSKACWGTQLPSLVDATMRTKKLSSSSWRRGLQQQREGTNSRGSVGVSVKVTRGQTADAPESGEVSLPPLLVVGNTETTRSQGVMGGLNGHELQQKFRRRGMTS